MLALGIDGSNVSKSKLAEELQKRAAKHFLDVGTCSIHIANNAFLEGIECLKGNVNADHLATDLYFFFKLSAAKRKDYRGVRVNRCDNALCLKHCQTCQSASEDYRTVQKLEGMCFKKTTYAAWI